MKYEDITAKQLGKGSSIKLEVVNTDQDIYYHMALHMIKTIKRNNEKSKNTVFIVPVGPVGQYEKFAYLCNQDKISLKNVYFINMDDYLDDNDQLLPKDHPLSFKGFMDKMCYDLIDSDIIMPAQNRIFPKPGHESEIQQMINELGGIDVAYGGIGINGHIAFNEPPEPNDDISDEDFKNLPTRILELSRETRTINAVTAANGYIDFIPKRCITVGMKEILSAKKIRFYMNRMWQRGIVRKLLHGDVTANVPASFFQQHNDAKLTIASYVAEQPLGKLR